MSSNIIFVYLIDEKDKTCIGYKNGQVNIKHVGRFEIRRIKIASEIRRDGYL